MIETVQPNKNEIGMDENDDSINEDYYCLSMKLWIIYLVVCVCTIVTFSVIALIGNASWWNGSFWGDEWYENDYCEYVNVDGFLRQKSNTISNLPFVLVGEFLIFLYMNDTQKNKDKKELAKVNQVIITYTDPKVLGNNCDGPFCTGCTIKQYPIWTLIYGIKLIYLGIASCLFHGSMKSLGQRLDVAAIYANVFLNIGYSCMYLNIW